MQNTHVGRHISSAFIFAVLLGLAAGSSDGGAGADASSNEPDKISAWTMAEQFVTDRLKSPSTADFGSVFGEYQDPNKAVTALGDNKFRVRGWVDAQNSFGATLRTHFVLELKYVGDNRWQLTSFQMGQ